ncbi:MAG: insulinase family protein [Natronospirillum sp.]
MTHTFELLDRQPIASLNLELQHFRHPATGAEHYHLATDHQEKVFMVALRTVPHDNTGVAHILEHTVLCGSERYPVRDPFFLMMRRSLNTFMNAFTSSDWTAYPFASENDKDFKNLLDVYLDAVFFSNLAELDFSQEGHRLAMKDANDPNSELEFRGVVYNEMKGAMSSATSRLYQALTKYVFPTTTYHFNSGGEPQSIPSLSYDALKQFYRRHYHPGNAIFLTFGQVDVDAVQTDIEEHVMQRFTTQEQPVAVPFEERYNAPVEVTEHYPVALADDEEEKPRDHVVMGWLLGDSADVTGQLEAHFLSEVLMGNSSSPLRAALETTDLAASASPMMGVEDSNREMLFVCGVEGTTADQAKDVEQLILSTLQQVIDDGAPLEDQAAVLHQLELSQREIGGDGMPFGLQLSMSALPAAVQRGDVVGTLDIDQALITMQEAIKQPSYLAELIGRLLLDNPHRVRLTLKADPQFSSRAEREEQSRLARLGQTLTTDQKTAINQLNATLEAHQQTEPDMDLLPKVTLEDIPKTLRDRKPGIQTDACTAYREGTNGLTYLTWLRPLPEVSADQLPWLPLYTYLLTEVGHGDLSYLDVQRQEARVTGGRSAGISTRASVEDPQRLHRLMTVNSKALDRNADAMNELLQQTVLQARFDETDRLHEQLQTQLTRRLQGVTGGGHSLAMTAAAAHWSVGSGLQHVQNGLSGIEWLKRTVKSDKASYINDVRRNLESIHDLMKSQKGHLLAIGDQQWVDQSLAQAIQPWADQAEALQPANHPLDLPDRDRHSAWITDTPVNFCAQAFQAVPVNHPDAAPLAVLGGVLSNGFLHTAIREQGGAYGGGANYDITNGVFRFFSYRDPRFEDTFTDFNRSLEWLQAKDLGYQPIEESVLSLISSMDKPGSPAGEARKAFFDAAFGRDLAFREALRARVLAVTADDLKRVANLYLQPDLAATAVVTGSDRAGRCKALNMTIHQL